MCASLQLLCMAVKKQDLGKIFLLPHILLLYVKDFCEKLEGENDVVQFADDTSIICKFERNENIHQKLKNY